MKSLCGVEETTFTSLFLEGGKSLNLNPRDTIHSSGIDYNVCNSGSLPFIYQKPQA